MSTPNPQPGYPNPAPFGPPPQKASRRKAWITHGAVAFVALVVGAGIGGSGDADAHSGKSTAKPAPTATVTTTAKAEAAAPAPTVTKTVTAKPKKTEATGPASSFGGDGEYLVGEDIKAGTYKTAGPDSAFGCYWERAKDASGEFGSIITNNNLNGPGRVTLNNGEIFKTNRCQKWTKVG